GQAESQPGMGARGRGLGLAELLEHVRQELGEDAPPGVGDLEDGFVAATLDADGHPPPGSVNLATLRRRRVELSRLERIDPADHGVERGAQLVGWRGSRSWPGSPPPPGPAPCAPG